MDPLTLMALLSGGTSLIGGLMAKGNDPFSQYMKIMQQFANPQTIGGNTKQFYQQFLQSPAFAGAQNANFGMANNIRSQMASRLGQSGMGLSGIGQTAQAGANSALGPLMSQLYSQGWQGAQGQAMDLLSQQLGGLRGAPQPWNLGGQLFGAGMTGLGDVMKMFMMRNRPTGGAGGTWQYGGGGMGGQDPFSQFLAMMGQR